ncbi:MAG: RNA polymerase sigma factor [Anaerolineae bacterium]
MLDESNLLLKVKEGDEDAFQQLQTELEPQIRRFVRRLIGSSHAEDDIIQDTFIALYRNLERIEPIEKLRPYLYGIARNRCYTELRQTRRYESISLDDEPEIDFGEASITLADDATPPEEVTHWLMLHLEVQQAMKKLPEVQRQVLLMYSEENLSYQEIAEIMNTSVGTIKSRIFYAKRALRSLLRLETLKALEMEFDS